LLIGHADEDYFALAQRDDRILLTDRHVEVSALKALPICMSIDEKAKHVHGNQQDLAEGSAKMRAVQEYFLRNEQNEPENEQGRHCPVS